MNKKVKLTVSLLVIGSASVLAYLGYKKYFGVATQTDEPTSLPKETMQDRIEEKVVDIINDKIKNYADLMLSFS